MARTPKQAAPAKEDLRVDDQDYNPKVEPKKSKAWLNMLLESEKAFERYNDHCDKIDQQYASLEKLSNMSRDKEFQMFWANCEVIKPSIYAKPPVPVVVPKFKDRRPVYQAASEVAERCAHVAFDLGRINELMMLVRDDVALISRGIAWCRYESGKNKEKHSYYDHEKVCLDFKNRRDFLHSISRTWPEVSWVAGASYLTRGEARKRFFETSGVAYRDAEYRVDKDSKEVGGADNRERAKFWEIWSKTENRVLWVAQGCEDILDEDDPHLDLPGFFPCPKPAYGTVQRGSLVPVPDIMQYRDQLDEINLLTSRIHALSDALEAKGFYPSGGAELSEAVQSAIRMKTKGRLLVPIANWASFGGSKEVIIWLPIDMIAQTITALVALRKQVIEDIYQIMGLADIMRGATDPNETLGAQELKSEYGSKRIKDKQGELVRLSRDLVEIMLAIILHKFSPVTIIEMSQTQLPTMEMVQKQITDIMKDMQQKQQMMERMMQMPQVQQMAQQKPEMAQQAMQQFQGMMSTAQATITKLREKPTIEQVLAFLKNNRAKGFVLDIETDSTIQADENADKQRRTEFVGVLGTLLPQLAQMVAAEPETAEFCGELLKFATAPFRAGRSLDGTIDELVEKMKQKGGQQKPNPDEEKTKALVSIEKEKIQAKKETDTEQLKLEDKKITQADTHKKLELQNARTIEQMRLNAKKTDQVGKVQETNQKMMQSREEHQLDMFSKVKDIELEQVKGQTAVQTANARQVDMAQKADERRAAQAFKQSQSVYRPTNGGVR